MRQMRETLPGSMTFWGAYATLIANNSVKNDSCKKDLTGKNIAQTVQCCRAALKKLHPKGNWYYNQCANKQLFC
jgi:hypothetical protein